MKPIAIMRTRPASGGGGGPSYGPELVTNGTFDADTSGWTALNGATLSVVAGRGRITNVGGLQGVMTQQIAVEVGETYAYSMTGVTASGNGRTRIGTTAGGTNIVNNTLSGTYSGTFVAAGASVYISGATASTTAGATADIDNMSLRKVL